MDRRKGYRVAIVGAGPRGTSVLERLLANQRLRADGTGLQVHLVDPYPPGPGHVWRPDQSRLFLMNTPALFPTVVPAAGDSGGGLEAGPVAGMSFDAWREAAAAGRLQDIPPADREEAAALGPAGFPSRALYGRYLAWTFARLAAAAAEARSVRLSVHAADAVRLSAAGDGYELTLADGGRLAADAVVLALGHVPAALNAEQQDLQDQAARHGLHYLPPNVPGDVDWNRIPAGRTLLVRGLGLNFFDLMVQLTEGRGGRFRAAADGRLAYEPSGKEPLIVAGSRRGTPYRAKAALDSYIPASLSLEHFTRSAAGALYEDGIVPGFDHDFWPLLHRDVLRIYYGTLARVEPGVVKGHPLVFLEGLDQLLALQSVRGSRALLDRVRAYVADFVPAEHRLDVEALARPFGGRNFASAAEYHAAMLAYLDADAAGSARGEDDPLKMAIGALNAGRSLIKELVADGGLTEEAWQSELRGWFEPLVEGLASGPPPLRISQLAALVRAGTVEFVGPDPHYSVDPETGRFRAVSPWVADSVHEAAHLVEAMMPANRVGRSLSPLLRRLLEDGLGRPRLMLGVEGGPEETSGLDVTKPPYRLVGANGRVNEGLYVLGLQLSSVQWGTSIAAEAGASVHGGARTLKDADDIARDILDRATR
ncbi:FAD/NAD(P)-binding protein [Arthrobacter sp. I2-34]|uniref:FAD/NAD(P)-binding protein n=1 Tax=Arthrobacter hankyongi TaxID=2904801 RepID=A0ABS9L8C3_9MICC|nr:FAD/NAD(P)-binding protein [Arthrobacter hankyongi]MCG2622909.1 FAD/NAD(P)-binding protein [Arthrobacter hankyongi]